jgi:putative radical SAM enzyme (TIGR03279 family)
VFCFVDQQPPGLRQSLYFKDDDARLSFLHGNYVTLTNLSEGEVRRLAGYHLSPLRISVHAADLNLRKKMMGCENAGNLFTALKIFSDAGIKMHFQIVLCKGLNDGEALSHTISVLSAQKGAESLAVVPAGIARHRAGLESLVQFTSDEAKKVLSQIGESPRRNFVFAADEWYIMAGEPLPAYEHYADFPQLDNGVGMLRLFEREFMTALPEAASLRPTNVREGTKTPLHIGIVTGVSASAFMRGLAQKFEKTHNGVNITVHEITNNFFGENITVSGLLTGEDIIAQLNENIREDVLFLPQNAFRANTEIMLDGMTLLELSNTLNVPVKIGSANGSEFCEQLGHDLNFFLEPKRGA